MLTDEFYSSVSSFVMTLQSREGEIDARNYPHPLRNQNGLGKLFRIDNMPVEHMV